MQQRHLFENYSYCKACKRPLPLSYKDDYCPVCKEQNLFHRVKDFIRENEVNEYQVAAEFNLPVSKVKEWIREGRIEYKKTPERQITMHCQACGAPLTFGTLCQKCLKQRHQSGTVVVSHTEDSGNMRHLRVDSKKI